MLNHGATVPSLVGWPPDFDLLADQAGTVRVIPALLPPPPLKQPRQACLQLQIRHVADQKSLQV